MKQLTLFETSSFSTLDPERLTARKKPPKKKASSSSLPDSNKIKAQNFAPHFTEILNVRHNYLTIRTVDIANDYRRKARSEKQILNEENLKLNHQVNKETALSKKAAKRVWNAVNWMFQLSENKKVIIKKTGKYFYFRVNFITLTLSSKQAHSDKVIKAKLLKQMLVEMKNKHGMVNYFWKAESQKNGNIHFHIATDIFIHYKELQNDWNRIQNKLKYIDKYEKKHGNRNPNSTDIHKAFSSKAMSAYCIKYFIKEDKTRAIEGRKWFCSNTLSKIKPAWEMIFNVEGLTDELNLIYSSQKEKVKKLDYCDLILINQRQLKKLGCIKICEIFNKKVQEVKKEINEQYAHIINKSKIYYL